jgi:hypothetical protein
MVKIRKMRLIWGQDLTPSPLGTNREINFPIVGKFLEIVGTGKIEFKDSK